MLHVVLAPCTLQVKVDSKSRKDLQKYILRKRKKKEGLSQEEVRVVCSERHPCAVTRSRLVDVRP